MPSWNAKSFFFLVVSFLIFVVSRGDGQKWKSIFSGKMVSSATTATASVPLPVVLQPITPIPLGA